MQLTTMNIRMQSLSTIIKSSNNMNTSYQHITPRPSKYSSGWTSCTSRKNIRPKNYIGCNNSPLLLSSTSWRLTSSRITNLMMSMLTSRLSIYFWSRRPMILLARRSRKSIRYSTIVMNNINKTKIK